MINIQTIPLGEIGLVQQSPEGRIVQIGLNPQQHNLLQVFLAAISEDKPLVQMGEEYDLIYKDSINK